jgi:hypothetical protein
MVVYEMLHFETAASAVDDKHETSLLAKLFQFFRVMTENQGRTRRTDAQASLPPSAVQRCRSTQLSQTLI